MARLHYGLHAAIIRIWTHSLYMPSLSPHKKVALNLILGHLLLSGQQLRGCQGLMNLSWAGLSTAQHSTPYQPYTLGFLLFDALLVAGRYLM